MLRKKLEPVVRMDFTKNISFTYIFVAVSLQARLHSLVRSGEYITQ